MSSSSLNKIAIVGMGGLFPDANNLNEYWSNIINKKVSIYEAPDDYLNKECFYDKDVISKSSKDDKTYTKICGIIKDFKLDPRQFKIPPMVIDQMDPNQQASLYAADQAISEVSLDNIDKAKIAVFMGDGSYGGLHSSFEKRIAVKEVIYKLKQDGLDEETINKITERYITGLKPITEDSAPGTLRNITAGRIANVYDFHGPSYTLNSACASGLTAIIRGIEGLQSKSFDAVVCGATDMDISTIGFSYFSAINALSPDGAFPFDERANGFIMGQGAGVVVLKRVEDAIRDKDNIYAVISGFGQASDGKGKAIAAPEKKWQSKTIEQACKMANYSPETIEYIEAHGTSTKVGDVVETQALKDAFKNLGATSKNYCGLSSVKANIGHLKSAAGIAGFIKATLAIHNKTLPPTASFKKVNPKLEIENSPFYVIDEPKKWEAKEHPRRAGVSAFGFGGADYHIAIEEYRADDYKNYKAIDTESEIKIISDESYNVLLSGKSLEELTDKLSNLSSRLNDNNLKSEIFKSNCLSNSKESFKVAFNVTGYEDYKNKQAQFLQLHSEKPELLELKNIYYTVNTNRTKESTALMFPGQGAQYPDMLLNLNSLETFKRNMQTIDTIWESKTGSTVSSLISSKTGSIEETSELLRKTENTHPTVFSTSISMYEQLRTLGLDADYFIGHSLGEITALAAAKVIDLKDSIDLVHSRGYSFKDIEDSCDGLMAAIRLSKEETQKEIETFEKPIYLANINSPSQTIISGAKEDIKSFLAQLDKKKIKNSILNVSHPFHSPLVKDAETNFNNYIKSIDFNSNSKKIIANQLGDYYPRQGSKVKKILNRQITSEVNFVQSIKKLYKDGVRLFIEIGPSSILSNLTKKILDDSDVKVISSNFPNKDDLETFNNLICSLYSQGIELQQPKVINTPIVNEVVNRNVKEDINIVFSGASIGLPGSHKETFRDDNFEQLFRGHNLIEKLSDSEKKNMVDLQVSKLIKSEKGASFKTLSNLNEVIQLAGKAGKLDLKNYLIPEKEIRNMSSTIAMAVAAGYEALRDAKIPLIREYTKTASGKHLPGRWMLPEEMQEDTGIIFPNGFPMVDPIITEVSRYISYVYGSKMKKDLIQFYEEIIAKISDYQTKKQLTDWFAIHFLEISDNPGEEDIYQFNHHFMNQIASQANNRLASYIGARGPNFQINAACSSTSTSITIAEDFIKSGRAKRVIIIGGDDPTSETNMPLIGSGFLCTGAATTSGNVYDAAVPFDKRRNGMIMGSGAIGIVIEDENETKKRGVQPVCELVGTHIFNTAGHPSRIEFPHYEKELNKFISNIEIEHNIDRRDMASKLLYMSHETYTPAKGGCSQTEAKALRATFKDAFSNIIISNTKGMTGHTMGASIEDAVAAKSLQYGLCPPIVNHMEHDPELEGLNLSSGGEHKCEYALKMAAGFGAQGNYVLLKKVANIDNRLSSEEVYNNWLKEISGDNSPELEYNGRLLTLKDKGAKEKAISYTSKPVETVPQVIADPKTDLTSEVLKIFSEVTGYPVEMLEPEMEMEADLGIDTVKQATVLGILGDEFGFEESEDFRLSDYPTIAHIIKLFSSSNMTARSVKTIEQEAIKTEQPKAENRSDITAEVLKIFSEVTGYPVEMLEPEMEMEADLGIDTVKQATVLGILGDEFGFEESEDFRLSDYPTIAHIIKLFSSSNVTANSVKTIEQEAIKTEQPKAENRGDITTEVLKIFSEVTGYPVEMLEPEMEMEADLGIDTVKQATVLGILGDEFGFEDSEDFKLSDYPTIAHIIKLFSSSNVTPNSNKTIEQKVITTKQPKAENRGDITSEVLKIFSEVTGYPVEMLEPEMEMEADLGIDTVKQATVLGILGDEFGFEESEDFKLSDYPTIGHIIKLFSAGDKKSGKTKEKAVEETDTEKPEDKLQTISNLTRQVVVLCDEKLGEKNLYIKDSSILLLGEYLHTEIKEILSTKGAKVTNCLISDTPPKGDFDIIIDTTYLGDNIDLLSIDKSKAYDSLNRAGEEIFSFYKVLDSNLKRKPKRIICMTSIDGKLGFDPAGKKIKDPIYGSYTGFYKSLRKEWNTDVKVIDFSPASVKKGNTSIIETLIKETEQQGNGFEICYINKKRKVLKVDEKELKPVSNVNFSEKSLFVVTGGATGITFEIVKGMAYKYKCNFAIIGRTEIPDNIKELSKLTDKELENIKKDIHLKLKERHSKVSPVMVGNEYGKIEKAIEIDKNLKLIEESGAKVSYYSGDVSNYQSMESIFALIKDKYETIDGIIHGAGIEISHLIEKKTVEEFNKVYKTKVLGAYNLTKLTLDEPLKLVVAFSSISGRFGNAAQLDYSAANSFLSYWVKWMKGLYSSVNALSIIWSGWKDVGMAWRNDFVRLNSENQGLNLIEKSAGVDAFIKEIEHNTGDMEIIFHKGLGDIIEPGISVETTPRMPFIDRIEKRNGVIVKAYKNLSVSRDEFMNQHRLGETPLMPAVAYMELCTEYYSILKGIRSQYVIKDLDIIGPLKLFKERSREIYVDGELNPDNDFCNMTMYYNFSPKNSNEVTAVPFSMLTLTDNKPSITSFDKKFWTPKNITKKKVMDYINPDINSSQTINFGPLYQDLMRETSNMNEIEASIGDDGVIYPLAFPEDQITNSKYPLDDLLINPCIIDSIFQGAAVCCISLTGRIFLPCGAKEFGIVNVAKEVDDFRVYVKLKSESENEILFDAVMVNSKDEVNYYAKDIKFKKVSL